MSVSDVIDYTLPSNEKLYLFCDDFGFIPIDFGEKYRYCRISEYISGTGAHDDYVLFHYANGEGERTPKVNVDFILLGLRQGTCSVKEIDILTPSEVLQTIHVSERAKRKESEHYAGENPYKIFSKLLKI